MRAILILLIFQFINYGTILSQQCTTFQLAELNGIRMQVLDSVYTNATKSDKTDGVFTGKKLEKWTKAWGDYFVNLMQYFSDNELIWGNPTYCFNKIYFKENGQVDFWLFNFRKSDSISTEKQEKYLVLLKEYTKTHKINISAKIKFTQCAGVDFMDMEKSK